MSRCGSRFVLTLLLIGAGGPGMACTIGVFSGSVMTGQRPVLWKNRDVQNPDQALHYFSGPRFPYLGEIYAGETSEVWAGINQAGFAVMNSNSFNLGSGAPGGMGDGVLMKLALQNCVSIDDFENLLDSIRTVGLAVPCNLGVMDSTGATAMFETGAYSYTRIDTDSVPEGFMVRANFSLSAESAGQKSQVRFLQARQLVTEAIRDNQLSCEYLIERISRDLGAPGFNPYPLPFRGSVQGLPQGFLPTSTTLSRSTTRAGIYLEGRHADEPAMTAAMWVILGEPTAGIAVPLWVAAGSVPPELRGEPRPVLCAEAQRLRERLYSEPTLPSAINSFRLAETDSLLAPAKALIYAEAAERRAVWTVDPPEGYEVEMTQDGLAVRAASAYAEFWRSVNRPPEPPDSSEFRLAVERARVVFRFPGNPGNRALSVIDAGGRRKARFDLSGEAYRGPGACELAWRFTDQSQGMHFAVLESGSGLESLRFTVVR